MDVPSASGFAFIVQKNGALPGARYVLAFRQLENEIGPAEFQDLRRRLQKATQAMWLFREVGLYLILCGKKELWENQTKRVAADKTGLHGVIVNAVHFVDPESRQDHLSTSSWGSLEFGDVRRIAKVVAEELQPPAPAA